MKDTDAIEQFLKQEDADRRHTRGGRELIMLEQYFGSKINHPDATPERKQNAVALLSKVNRMLDDAYDEGVKLGNDPDTGTQISGAKGGAGDGGFRLSTSSTGRPGSTHKEGLGIDIFDFNEALDNWLTNPKLEAYGLYREAPEATKGWCHLQSRPPRSGARTYYP